MTKAMFEPNQITRLRPLNDNIIVSDMSFDERKTTGGIVLLSDDMKSQGIRPRWAKVHAIGPDQYDVKVGQYVLVDHGRWTRGVDISHQGTRKTIRRVDPNDILCVSDEQLFDETMSDKT